MDPLALLKRAIAAVPAVRYALGVAGIAAVVAIILRLKLEPQVAVFGILVVFGLMFVLVIIAEVAGQKDNSHLLKPAKVLVWFYTVVIMVVTILFIFKYSGLVQIPLHQPASSSENVPETPPGGTPPPKVTPERQARAALVDSQRRPEARKKIMEALVCAALNPKPKN